MGYSTNFKFSANTKPVTNNRQIKNRDRAEIDTQIDREMKGVKDVREVYSEIAPSQVYGS